MLKTVVFICAVATIVAKSMNFKDCGSEGGVMHTLDMDPCDTDPCQLHGNITYTAHVNFTAKEDITSATTHVYGIIGGVPIPFEVPPDACKDMKCPITAGTTEIYTNGIFCDPKYPKIKLAAEWKVQDANKKNIFCFVIPIEIVD